MRLFYEFGKSQALPDELTWSHYIELLVLDDANKINYYINITIKNNLSTRQLRTRIKNKEYERLDDKTKNKLVKHESLVLEDTIKKILLINNEPFKNADIVGIFKIYYFSLLI